MESWGQVAGEADWLVPVQASVVFLSLITLVSDVIMSGAFVTVVG